MFYVRLEASAPLQRIPPTRSLTGKVADLLTLGQESSRRKELEVAVLNQN